MKQEFAEFKRKIKELIHNNSVSVPDPVSDPVSDPFSDPVPDPFSDPFSDPVPDPVSDPVPDPVSDPVPDPVFFVQQLNKDVELLNCGYLVLENALGRRIFPRKNDRKGNDMIDTSHESIKSAASECAEEYRKEKGRNAPLKGVNNIHNLSLEFVFFLLNKSLPEKSEVSYGYMSEFKVTTTHAIIQIKSPDHYIALRRHEGNHYWLLDSLNSEPILYDYHDILTIYSTNDDTCLCLFF